MNIRYRTRVKYCGMTRAQDVHDAVALGADALGFVFYGASPRHVTAAAAGALLRAIPPFVSTVGLFVNATAEEVAATLEQAPVTLLQFHGDETLEQCCAIAARVGRPFLRAVRVDDAMRGADLLEYESRYRAASPWFSGLLLDAWSAGYGGSGKGFDWSLIPEELAPRVVLSGGLSAQNVADAVLNVRPYAVDVSSGIERAKGIKDGVKMRAFMNLVRQADTGA